MHGNLSQLVIGMAVAALAGCAASTNVVIDRPIEVQIEEYSQLEVRFSSEPLDPSATQRNRDELAEDISRLKGLVLARLQSMVAFETVSEKLATTEGALVLDLEFTTNSRVSNASRVHGGVLAGRASVSINVTLTDHVTGTVLGSGTVMAKSSAGATFSGTTSQALEKAAEGVLEFMAPLVK